MADLIPSSRHGQQSRSIIICTMFVKTRFILNVYYFILSSDHTVNTFALKNSSADIGRDTAEPLLSQPHTLLIQGRHIVQRQNPHNGTHDEHTPLSIQPSRHDKEIHPPRIHDPDRLQVLWLQYDCSSAEVRENHARGLKAHSVRQPRAPSSTPDKIILRKSKQTSIHLARRIE